MRSELPLLEAQNLGRCVADPGTWLFRQVSLTVRPGQRVAIAGASGSGKSLFLRALALLDPLDAGQLWWRGRPVARRDIPAYRSQVVYLHQQPALSEGTVESNLRYAFAFGVHRPRRFDRQRAVALLESLQRDATFLTKQQQHLSGGEMQIAVLLRAILLDPCILLLDEPTAALDADSAHAVVRLVQQWLAEEDRARATVWVTHDQAQAAQIADHIFRIRDGTLIGEA